MMLLEITTTTTISDPVLVTIVIALLGSYGTIAFIFFKGMTKRFDRIDNKLDPLGTQVAIHSEQIKDIRIDVHELTKWQGNLDGRVQSIERKVFPIIS